MAAQSPYQDMAVRVLQLAKAFMQETPYQLYVYTIEQMGQDIGAAAFRQTGRGQALSLRPPRNTTKQLRFVTNKLSHALEPNAKGNIAKVGVKDGMLEVEYGIDLDVVPYARIHELGGTINHPGGTPYKVLDDKRVVFVNKRDGADLPKTRAHDIKIPARPYLKPAFIEWQQKEYPRFLSRLAKMLDT
jgi:phage gpG-like protein